MKEVTKKKIKKIAKVSGFIITFGFAVFGALCAAMLMANGSGAKDNIKTLDSSLFQNEVRSERNSKPRKAPEFDASVNLWDSGVYFDDAYLYPNGAEYIGGGFATRTFYLQAGYYYLGKADHVDVHFCSFTGTQSYLDDWLTLIRLDNRRVSYPENLGFVSHGLFLEKYFYVDTPMTWGFSYYQEDEVNLYLVDTAELPASSSVYLGENWNPLKAFGDTLSENGGYLLTEETWNYGSQTYKSLVISGLLFKYEGVVYDRIQMHAKPLNALHYPYVDSSGAIVESPSTQNSGPNEIYVLDYVGFAQSWMDDGTLPVSGVLRVMVGGKADTPSPSGKLPYNGSLQWVTSSRTIQIIDNKGTTTGRYNNRFSYMTDLEFINMLAEYESEGIEVVNSGQMFGLFTNAFDSLLPILSISILPNISLGMLLFIPLIGAIIVIIIRVVKK